MPSILAPPFLGVTGLAASSFTPAAYATVSAVGTAKTYPIPGSGAATLVITNLGPYPAVVLLGTVANPAVALTPGTGMAVAVGQPLALVIGANTFISVISAQGIGTNAVLNLAAGS